MKYMKKSQIYKAANVTFNPQTIEAYSYAWWKFVGIVEGKVVFNDYRYSPSTGRHQQKVKRLMSELGIRVDVSLPIPQGLFGTRFKSCRADSTPKTLEQCIVVAEEYLCNKYLDTQVKNQEKYLKQKTKRFKAKLEEYLDVVIAFRDYEIKPKSQFGTYNKIAVHQVVEDIEQDVQNAIHSFQRDAFGAVVFYV